MITVRVPLRMSLFGGSTDYKSFYEKHGSFIVGSTINKYIHLSIRIFPFLLSNGNQSRFSYSKIEVVNTLNDIENPLIREVLKYKNIGDPIEFISFIDIPSRTGLGGSSSFCVGLIHLINKLYNISDNKQTIAKEAIHIERNILKEPGGIQDQIWASYGGFNTIEINTAGNFYVKPIPITPEFRKEFEKHLILVYTNNQRNISEIAESHNNKNKDSILRLAKEGYNSLIKENIKDVGKILMESWYEKRKLSNLITTETIDYIISDFISSGVYGAKLLGSGGCGFILVICDPITKQKIKEKYKEKILEINFEFDGVCEAYRK